jgi:para-aminobenzoate synthetase component II
MDSRRFAGRELQMMAVRPLLQTCLSFGVVLVIDNYDSFTYNLVQYLGEMKVAMEIRRNDQISLDQIRELNPDRILVSPGPCSPRESGLSNDIIRGFGTKVPLLGVCLGTNVSATLLAGNVIVNYRIMHGKTSLIRHNGKDLFRDMPNPFAATRYHSLVIQRESLPDCLEVTAETEEGRNHGRAAQGISDLGRAIPPGKHPDRKRPANPQELHVRCRLEPVCASSRNMPKPARSNTKTYFASTRSLPAM